MTMEDTKKTYKPMENVLNCINSKVIALQDHEKSRNTKILDQVTLAMIKSMKQLDPLFSRMFERTFYGGSYYDKLKVGNPDEYDLDLVLNLPVRIKASVMCSNIPGFVHVVINEHFQIAKMPDNDRQIFGKMNDLLDQEKCYLLTTNFLSWMESIITKALQQMPNVGTRTYVDVILDEKKPNELLRIYVELSKGAPAFTMKLSGKTKDKSDIKLDVDLVPCFQFKDEQNWPKNNGYRPNTSTSKKNFLVVAKKPKGEEIQKSPLLPRYWRLSFQEQERELIGKDYRTLKPSLRLLKKLRDKHNHCIASYFIKTIFLWSLEEEKDLDKKKAFWSQPLSNVFMFMLKKYAELLRVQKIPYYWNSQFNLIGYLKKSTVTVIANNLERIISNVERNISVDPLTIGQYLLFPQELEQLKNVPLAKKFENNFAASTSIVLTTGSSGVDTPDSSQANNSPPLINDLKFDKSFVHLIRQYSDSLDEQKEQEFKDIMAQINNRPNGALNNNGILIYLQRLDEKMDTLLERFDKSEENNREIALKLATLETKVQQLELENAALTKNVEEPEIRED